MALFVISYDLRKNRDYQKLWDELDRLNAHKALNSLYFADLDNTAEQVKDHLTKFIDDDDGLVVVEFSEKPARFKARPGTNNWIDQRF